MEDTLNNPRVLEQFKTFLKNSRSGDKSIAEQYLDVYEQCETYKNNNVTNLTSDQIEELSGMGLPYYWEKELKNGNQTGDISSVFQRIQQDLRNRIELSEEYKAFTDKLLNI